MTQIELSEKFKSQMKRLNQIEKIKNTGKGFTEDEPKKN